MGQQWQYDSDHDHENDSDMEKNAGIVKEWAEWAANTMTMNKKWLCASTTRSIF